MTLQACARPSPRSRQLASAAVALALAAILAPQFGASPALAADAAQAEPADAGKVIDARPWPREYKVGGVAFALYRPEVDAWTGNRLQARVAVAVDTGPVKTRDGKTATGHDYGVAWVSARTETDKASREVTLDDISFERVSFPTAPAKEAQYLAAIRQAAPSTALVASLDQVESDIALTKASLAAASQPVDNTPPDIIFDFQPGVLVLIDGDPVWRPAGPSGVERVVNSRALVLRAGGRLYLGYGGHWATASALTGPWAAVAQVPAGLDQVMKQAMAARQVPAEDQAPADVRPMLAAGRFPDVFVSTKPAELIVVDGEPSFAPIEGTQLSYVANTPADVLVDASADNAWYVLISGRWFTAASSKGPWTYVASTALPAQFKSIPSDSPKSAVLASIPGTPEAKESLVANSVPQTATVDRTQASFTARYDGAPQFKPIAGTSLAYAWNSPAPVIRVAEASYFALDNGVWFSAPSPQGPWQVATSVPAAIYAIPAASPLHYVTYAQVYGSNGNEVYVGYTPGYFGTVVSDGVVVYGAAYPCTSWIGEAWYGCPAAYGYGAAFGWGPALGWALAFGWGWADPWYDPWWGPWAGYWPGYYPWGGAVAGNVYGRWGNSVVAGTAAAWADPWTGNYGRGFSGGYYNTATGGRGYGGAGRNTNIYTGRSTAGAAGVRYNLQTGRVVAGGGGSIDNIYTGNGIAGGQRTVVNTNTGRVTKEGGVATRTGAGATAAGGFASKSANGNAAGAGYVHYNRATGDISHGGVVDVNGDIYAGHDGHVYKHDQGGGWEKAGGGGKFTPAKPADQSLDAERAGRDRGFERQAAGGHAEGLAAQRPAFDRSAAGGGFRGRMGGFRGGRFGGLRR